MKVQVLTINSVQKSSKSELSSDIFGHFKIWKNPEEIVPQQIRLRDIHER